MPDPHAADPVELWHNPRCSKSRAALALLTDERRDVTVRRYLDDPPDRAEVDRLVRLLGLTSVRDVVRTGEAVYRELGLADVDEDTLRDAIVAHPVLLERPVVVARGNAVVARPTGRIHDLLTGRWTVVVGGPEKRDIVVVDPDPTWPDRFAELAATVRDALGARVLALHHIGSTAVPDLPAKPIVDALLIVADPDDEDAWVPDLERAGFALRVREVHFHGHRMLRPAARDVHLHVLPPDCPETDRYLALRDRLRADPDERVAYATLKRELATRDWPTMQHYADAKTELIEAIIARAGGPPPVA